MKENQKTVNNVSCKNNDKFRVRVDHKNSERLFLLKKDLFDRLKEK